MERSKENEIIEILASFENEFKQIKENENQELQVVKYYECFKTSKAEIHGVFLTEQKDTDGNISYCLYFQNPSNEILSVDHEGNLKMNLEWKNAIGNIDLEKSIDINEREDNGLKGISQKAKPEEIQEKLKQEEEKEENAEEQIQKDIGGQEDLKIGYYREIKDQNFEEQIGMDLSGYEEIGLAYSEAKNTFILVGKKNGEFQQVEGFEPAQPTYKKVMSIDENGKEVEKEVPHAIMETNNDEKELSITIGQYGYIEVGTIDRLPCDARIKRQVSEQGETEKGRTTERLNRVIREEGIQGLHEWAHKNKQTHKQMEQGEERRGDIVEEISNEQGADENEMIRYAAEYRAKISEKEFRRILESVPENDTIENRINEVVKIVDEQYRENK